MEIQLWYVFCLLTKIIFLYVEYCIDVPTFDLGQNMAGLCRLRFNGSLGFGTYIHYGEILTKPDIASG
jgi:hypothetical protein